MEKRNNKYLLNLELEQYANGDNEPAQQLELHFENHDEIFSIIERIKQKEIFDAQQSAEFAIGLKLFSEVMIRNRKHSLFTELSPAFGEFMKKLKAL